MGHAEEEEFPRRTIPSDLSTQLKSCPELLCWVVEGYQLHPWESGTRDKKRHLTVVPAGFLPSFVGLLAPGSAGSSLSLQGPLIQALGAELSKTLRKSQALTHPPRCSVTAEQERLARIPPG